MSTTANQSTPHPQPLSPIEAERVAPRRTYGKVRFVGDKWFIEAEPHVMMRLKQVFPRVDKYQFNVVTLKHSPEVCRDIEWFITRYPLQVMPDSVEFLADQSRLHQQTLAALQALNLETYKPSVAGLAKPLREYQARAVEILWKRRMLLNADQLGLGKSVTAIGGLLRPDALPAVIVCQTHLQKQWEIYCAEFLPSARVHIIKSTKHYYLPPADVLIMTYHKMHGWVELLQPFIKTLVFDEVQELRHSGTGKYRAAKALRERAVYVTGLSATPIFNYGGEIFDVMEIIAPGQLGTEAEFKREWCESLGTHWILKSPEMFGSWLRDQFLMVRRTRAEVGRELPPLETVVEPVEYRKECLESIDTLATELAHRILKGSFHEQGEAAREFDMRLRQATGIAKAPYVSAFVKMLVEDGRKVLLSGWHRDVYDVWVAQLKAAGIRCVLYTGSESPKQKDEAKAAFLDWADVMIISHSSGAGLDGLQTVCNTVVHGELAFTPGAHEQIGGRLFRDGQNNAVQEFYLVSEGGSDPVIAEILGLKTAQVKGLLSAADGGLQKTQTDIVSRVKRMAEHYLNKKKVAAPLAN